jgi:hypothetical protein
MLILKNILTYFLLFNLNIAIAEGLDLTESNEDNVVSLVSTDEITMTEADRSATKAVIEEITAVKTRPLENPNAKLIDIALKFGRSNKPFVGFDQVYADYCKDARHGNANAQFALGWLHENGKGVPVDKSLAKVFYSVASEQHHSLAMKALPDLANHVDGILPDCMLQDPVVYVIKEPELTLEQLAEIETKKEQLAKEEAEREVNMARAERLFEHQKSIYKLVKKHAAKYKIDPKLIMSFIAIESAFDVMATSAKNAQGLMQLIPETAERFGVKDPYRAEDNIKGGIRYIRWLLAYYEGRVDLVAAAYNAGEKAVDRYQGVPPYAETQNYVKRLSKLYHLNEHPFNEKLVQNSSPILKGLNNPAM